MNTLISAGEAYMLAQIGQQQIAAAVLAGFRRLARRLLGRAARSVPASTAG